MAGPYKKNRSDVIDAGWAIEDGDGNEIAYLDTEAMADGMLMLLLECPDIPNYDEDVPYGEGEQEEEDESVDTR